MMNDKTDAVDRVGAQLIRSAGALEAMPQVGIFRATLTRNGEIVWEDEFKNLVFNAGKTDMLDKYFAGSSYTAAWYMGLVDGGSSPTYNAADVSSSHAGWTESTAYSNSTRVAIAWNAASASGGGSGSAGTGSKVSTATAFNINGSATIAGCFLSTLSTKSGTTGITFSGGSFTGGNRSVVNADTLNVTWTGSN